MRTIICYIALFCILCSTHNTVWAQGAIWVQNRVVGAVDAPVFDVDCFTGLEGDLFRAQAYVGLAPDALLPIGPVYWFREGDAAGYLTGADQHVIVQAAGLVYVQLRAWETSAGMSFEEALGSGGKYGVSNIFPVESEVPPGPPALLVGLESFCLVPEPSVKALLLSAGGILLVWRRRLRPSAQS